MEGNLRFKIDLLSYSWKEIDHFCFISLYLRAIFKYKPPGGLYSEGRFNGGFFLRYELGGLVF